MFVDKHPKWRVNIVYMSRSETGKSGEELAAKYLAKNGYKVMARNYLVQGVGEIDIVARDKDKALVFVEVKTMYPGLLKPEDQYSSGKRQRMISACRYFLKIHPEYLNEDSGWRMDLVAIELSDFESGKSPDIRHYQNI